MHASKKSMYDLIALICGKIWLESRKPIPRVSPIHKEYENLSFVYVESK